MLSQLPPRVWRGRTPGGWAALVAGLIVGVPVALAAGLALLALGVVVVVVGAVVALLALAAEWVWYLVQRASRVRYPFPVPAPRRG
jgi:uncharacterized RDD family membrane protein YckC